MQTVTVNTTVSGIYFRTEPNAPFAKWGVLQIVGCDSLLEKVKPLFEPFGRAEIEVTEEEIEWLEENTMNKSSRTTALKTKKRRW